MNSSGIGRLLSMAGRFGGLFTRREMVGADVAGNKYFRWKEKNHEGEMVEKRVCEYPDDDYDPTTVPVIWKSWLQGAREHPPSEADMAMIAKREADLKQKVAALEVEEEKRRFKAKSLEGSDMEEHGEAVIMHMLGAGRRGEVHALIFADRMQDGGPADGDNK
mmetsp:Transcript_43247/g.108355  ORF Transcript_43247/g.108355 Transcript_43247/m.108355 type:complete len:163 (-) Transcript_43247:588-1076(-)|eukprot:jgi/Tetstr1/465665/TSEL_010311.t1